MSVAAPALIVISVCAGVAYALYRYCEELIVAVGRLMEPYREGLERAAIPIRSEELAFMVLLLGVVPWGVLTFVWRPAPLLGVALLIITLSAAFFVVRMYVSANIVKRLNEFNNQLEIVLRLISGAMRVGLGLRQAMVNVVADMPDPARIEFTRVLSQTQIGVSVYDALDQLCERMPSSEIQMMANAVRLQSQTGGNLSRVLENLADTIRERRRLRRKVRTLTAEARLTKYIITALPLFVAGFIMLAEPSMRSGLLETLIGRVCLVLVALMLALGWYLFNLISKIDI